MPNSTIPVNIRLTVERLTQGDKRLLKKDVDALILDLDVAITHDRMNERDALAVLHRLPHNGLLIPRDPFERTRETYRLLKYTPRELRATHKKLGVHLEGFHMDEARDLIRELGDWLDPLHGYREFDQRHVPRKDGRDDRSLKGIQRALRDNRLDLHDVVSFDILSPNDVFGSIEQFIEVCHPSKPFTIRPKLKRKLEHLFAPDYILFANRFPMPMQLSDLIARDHAYRQTDSYGRYERLRRMLECVPVRLVRHPDGFTHVYLYDAAKLAHARRYGLDITHHRIDACYTVVAVVEDTAITESGNDIHYEHALSNILKHLRTGALGVTRDDQ